MDSFASFAFPMASPVMVVHGITLWHTNVVLLYPLPGQVLDFSHRFAIRGSSCLYLASITNPLECRAEGMLVGLWVEYAHVYVPALVPYRQLNPPREVRVWAANYVVDPMVPSDQAVDGKFCLLFFGYSVSGIEMSNATL